MLLLGGSVLEIWQMGLCWNNFGVEIGGLDASPRLYGRQPPHSSPLHMLPLTGAGLRLLLFYLPASVLVTDSHKGRSQSGSFREGPGSIAEGFLRREKTSDRKATWESLDWGDLYIASLVAQMVKNPPASAGDPASIPGSGRSPGERNDNPLHYFCLENSMDRGAWWATVHGIAKSQTQLTP